MRSAAPRQIWPARAGVAQPIAGHRADQFGQLQQIGVPLGGRFADEGRLARPSTASSQVLIGLGQEPGGRDPIFA